MKKLLLIFSLTLLTLPIVSFAAPAPWGIAINEKTKECAGYWSGDEFTYYKLPEGWQKYYPDYNELNENYYIDTSYGKCDFNELKEKDCCEELKLNYVARNIGEIDRDQDYIYKKIAEGQGSEIEFWFARMFYSGQLGSIVLFLLALLVIFIIIIFFRKKKKKKEARSSKNNSTDFKDRKF